MPDKKPQDDTLTNAINFFREFDRAHSNRKEYIHQTDTSLPLAQDIRESRPEPTIFFHGDEKPICLPYRRDPKFNIPLKRIDNA